MVIHTERSISALKTNRCELTQKAGAAAPKEAWRYTSWWWCVFGCFPGVPPVNLTSSHVGTEAVFSEKVHWSLVLEGWLSQWFIFITNSRWVEVFCRWQMLFFRQKCDKESVGQAGGCFSLHLILLPEVYQCQRYILNLAASDSHWDGGGELAY